MRHLEKQNQILRDMEENALSFEHLRKVRGGTDEGGTVTNNSDHAEVDEPGGTVSTAKGEALSD